MTSHGCSEDSFQTALSNSVKGSGKAGNPLTIPEKEIALDTVHHSHDIDSLMNSHGFFLVTEGCRAVCISNAPKTVEELEKAKNLKARLPNFVKNKIYPRPNSDDETPENLLVTLNDVTKKKKTKRFPKRRNTAPIQKNQAEVEIVELISSDEEKDTETKYLVGGAARKSSLKLPECQPGNEIRPNGIDRGEVIPKKPTSTVITQREENLISEVTLLKKSRELNKNVEMTEDNTRNEVEKGPKMIPSTIHRLQLSNTAGRRGPSYLGQEEKSILRFILDGNFEDSVTGNSVWLKMEEDGVCPGRPWQSMKNRFKRYICQNLSRPEFQLTAEEISRIKKPKQVAFSSRPIDIKRIPKAKKITTRTPESPTRESPSPHKGGFYDLDMNWSDSDSDGR